MFDVGSLVRLKRDSDKLGLIIDKKLIAGEPYAAPIEKRGFKRYPERLALLCYWASGETSWCDRSILIAIPEDKKCLSL